MRSLNDNKKRQTELLHKCKQKRDHRNQYKEYLDNVLITHDPQERLKDE